MKKTTLLLILILFITINITAQKHERTITACEFKVKYKRKITKILAEVKHNDIYVTFILKNKSKYIFVDNKLLGRIIKKK